MAPNLFNGVSAAEEAAQEVRDKYNGDSYELTISNTDGEISLPDQDDFLQGAINTAEKGGGGREIKAEKEVLQSGSVTKKVYIKIDKSTLNEINDMTVSDLIDPIIRKCLE